MRGPMLRGLLERDELKLPPGVDSRDLETMYSLLLLARGIETDNQVTLEEEKLALGALCRWSWRQTSGKIQSQDKQAIHSSSGRGYNRGSGKYSQGARCLA